MTRTEYKVVPAPEKTRKLRGLKGAALFAHEVEALMNELAADGWHYVRADTLPHEERAGLTSKTTTYRNLLIFQRDVGDVTAAAAPLKAEPAPAPKPASPPEPDDEVGVEVKNLWQPVDEPEDSTPALFPDRQRKGVDL